METKQLKIVTLNCWGLPDCLTGIVNRKYKNPQHTHGRKWVKRNQRIAAIANKLDGYDVVCLEEVWLQEDQEYFKSILSDFGLIYSHVYSSGIIGSSGLVILSRYPIQEVFFHRYRSNGQALRVDHGDYHAGKGFGFARIELTKLQTVAVILTHTIAKYNHDDDTYHADRISQVWDLTRFIQLTSRQDEPVIVVGDMNCKSDSVEYNILTQVGKLSDAYQQINLQKHIGGTTLGSGTIDYVLYKKCKDWSLVESKVVLNGDGFLYSDHFGVTATFTIESGTTQSETSTSSTDKKNLKYSLTNEYQLKESHEGNDFEETSKKLEKTILEQSASLVDYGATKAQKRKTNHLIRALLCMLILWVLVSNSAPSYWIGAVCIFMALELLIALFFVENEITALKQVCSEIKLKCKQH